MSTRRGKFQEAGVEAMKVSDIMKNALHYWLHVGVSSVLSTTVAGSNTGVVYAAVDKCSKQLIE